VTTSGRVSGSPTSLPSWASRSTAAPSPGIWPGSGWGGGGSSTRPGTATGHRARSTPAGPATWCTWTWKKVGRIPDGGGWRIHGRDSVQHRAVDRAKAAGARAGYVYLHSIVDGFSRLAYTEPLSDEKGATAAAFLARAKIWFAAHGITHLHRVVTDNGACYRSADFARIVGVRSHHQRTKPFTPRHNGKAERYQRILAEELLYARPYSCEEDRSTAIAVWNIHYNYHRPHSAADGRPPATRLKTGVTNVQPSYN
jgi:transposase InsO family protein